MQINAADYPSLKAFFAWAFEHLMPSASGIPPEAHPMAVLEGFEVRSIAIARKGLAMAIGDIIELTESLSPARVTAVDSALRAEGIITLTDVRARFWTRVRRIMERGALRGETDYYALRNVVETLSGDEQTVGWGLLAAYEQKAVAR